MGGRPSFAETGLTVDHKKAGRRKTVKQGFGKETSIREDQVYGGGVAVT